MALRAGSLAAVGFCVPVFLGPAALRHFHPDPMEWQPSDAQVRQALDSLPFRVRYSAIDLDGGLRWYRGRAIRRGVPVRFALLIGSGAAKRISPPENFRLLAGCSSVCEEGYGFRVMYASDADLLGRETRAARARSNTALDTSFDVIDAVTAYRD